MELPLVAHFSQEKIHFLKKMLSISIWGKISLKIINLSSEILNLKSKVLNLKSKLSISFLITLIKIVLKPNE